MLIDIKKDALKIIYVILMMAGTGLTVFNLLAFKSSKNYGAIWYQDHNQTWAMIGVLMILLAYFVKNWKKL
jgi:hypothetical protein